MDATGGEISASNARVLRASLFGDFDLAWPDGSNIEISSRRARALLAMLCLSPGEALERDYVSKLLWPGRFQTQARASLRQCLLALDKALAPMAPNLLDVSHIRVAVNPAAVETDLGRVEGALAAGDIPQACQLLLNIGSLQLLEQMDFGEAFRDWVSVRRASVEARLQIAVDCALAGLDEKGDGRGRSQLANAWRASGRTRARQLGSRIRVAILPFAQHDSVGGDLFLAEGVVEELSFRLSEVSALALIGRTSVLHVSESGKTLPEIADALFVSHLIEGEVYRYHDAVRVYVRLIDGQSGIEIWSDRYEGTMVDVVGSRQIIGNFFTAGLCTALGVATPISSARRMTPNREAYALYLQGRALYMKTIGNNVIGKAIERLEQALEIDPDFAECWAALAEAHLYSATFTPALDRLERAEKLAHCARKAISLDPMHGPARVTLAIYEFTRRNAVAALDLAFEAHRLAPTSSEVAIRLGAFLLFLGRPHAALPYIEAAIEQDPVHGRNYLTLCAAYLCLGQFDKAIAAGESMADLGFPAGPLAIAYAANGKRDRAIEIYYSMRMLFGTWFMAPPGMAQIDDTARDAYFMLGAQGVCSGDPDARAAYCQLLDTLHQTMPDPYDISIAYPAIYMGHAELVMKIYSEQPTLSNLFGLMTLWGETPIMRQTIEHPDFIAFAERIGFIAAWNKYGWPERLPRDPRAN